VVVLADATRINTRISSPLCTHTTRTPSARRASSSFFLRAASRCSLVSFFGACIVKSQTRGQTKLLINQQQQIDYAVMAVAQGTLYVCIMFVYTGLQTTRTHKRGHQLSFFGGVALGDKTHLYSPLLALKRSYYSRSINLVYIDAR
jgi:hypothetical protein